MSRSGTPSFGGRIQRSGLNRNRRRYFATRIAPRFAADRSDQAVLLNSGVAFVRRRDTSDNFDERGRNRRQRDHVVNNARVGRGLRHSEVLGIDCVIEH